eukprot:1279658-Lingulodinium_polyedra.AAC.1
MVPTLKHRFIPLLNCFPMRFWIVASGDGTSLIACPFSLLATAPSRGVPCAFQMRSGFLLEHQALNEQVTPVARPPNPSLRGSWRAMVCSAIPPLVSAVLAAVPWRRS